MEQAGETRDVKLGKHFKPHKLWDLARQDRPEWLDQGLGSDHDVRQNLSEMARINRFLGGDRALLRHLLPRLKAHPGPVSVLDLGTGSASLPAQLLRWAARAEVKLSVFGLDRSARCIRSALENTRDIARIQLLQGDSCALPFAHARIDYIISSLFLHHFSPAALVGLLRSAAEKAACGIVMSDLVRGRLPLLGFGMIQPILARNPLTRHDGALSIRRAYRPAELLAIARQAGLPGAQVYSHWPWRMTLVVDL